MNNYANQAEVKFTATALLKKGVVLTTALLLINCGGSSGGSPDPDTGNQGPKVGLKTSPSEQELEEYLRAGFAALLVTQQGSDDDAVADASEGASSLIATTTSYTNTQVEGVDEGDIWKYNGKHIYYQNIAANGYVVSVFEPGDPPSTTGDIDIAFDAEDLYVDDSHLVAVGGAFAGDYVTLELAWSTAYGYTRSESQVSVFDISAIDDATTGAVNTVNVTLDGALVSSRKIGDDLYLVSRHTANLEGWIDYPQTDADITANEQLLDEAQLSDFLPNITVNGETQALTTAANCYLVQDEAGGYPILTSITRIDVATGAFDNACVTGPVSGLYMSPGSAYLFHHAYDYVDFIDDAIAESYGTPSEQTHIHKFSLGDGLQYQGSNVVAGHASCNEARYCFGELNDGALALVTTYGWWVDVEHHLTILASDGLSIAAQLPNEEAPAAIGKPGELLYAARILGDRAYLVTFENTDPLYAIDLSNTAAPTILGELEVPGFSDYLHPVTDDLLLGIGKDAVSDASGNTFVQGVKVDLYDVSDMAQPSQIASYTLGKRGSSTPVSYDSHAFTSAWADDQFRFVIPVTIANTDESLEPSDYAPYLYDGFQAFEIDTNPNNSPQMYALPATQLPQASYTSFTPWYPSERSTLIGDSLYLFQAGKVYVSDWADTANVALME